MLLSAIIHLVQNKCLWAANDGHKVFTLHFNMPIWLSMYGGRVLQITKLKFQEPNRKNG